MKFLKSMLSALLICGVAVGTASTAFAKSQDVQETEETDGLTVKTPTLNAERGKDLFVQRYCVVCHSVNGVGGVAAPPLDAPKSNREVDILDFAARMWRGSYAMVELQATEFAYQIELEGDEIGDLAAFAYDLETQKEFSLDDVPPEIEQWILEFSISVEGGLFDNDE